jgi:hypothetical protein
MPMQSPSRKGTRHAGLTEMQDAQLREIADRLNRAECEARLGRRLAIVVNSPTLIC